MIRSYRRLNADGLKTATAWSGAGLARKNINMQLLDEALSFPQCVVSVIGDHAGESVDAIFHRKIADIGRTGKTFWLMKSPKARSAQVQDICRTIPAYTIFVEPAKKGGARPTTTEDVAREYSEDGESWHPLPEGMIPVTGKLDTLAAALVFDMMTTDVSGTLDLWGYGDFSDTQKPLKFIIGCSTACAVRKEMTSHPGRMKSRYRGVVVVARLAEPYCVWLR